MVDTVYANTEFYYSNVSPLTTNFNVSPYNDDFDEKKNFYRILIKPGYAVQNRELIQMQTMLQDQIQKFGRHIFQEGSMVLGGKFYLDTRAHYVKVNDINSDGDTVDLSLFQGEIVTGSATGIQAYVNYVVDGSESTDNPKTLYVTYLNSNSDTDEFAFAANEPLVANTGTLVVGNNIPVGYGSIFTINEGIRFAKNHFIYHPKQSIVLDRYGISPTCKVGFVLVEDIVTYQEDSSLLDPAQEASSYSAPGADRFRITPVLTRLDIDDVTGYPDYVNLFIIRDGIVTDLSERPTYNVIRDEIARRTMDESGDYYVNGFNVVVEEHLDNNNGGYLSYDRGGDSTKLSVQVEPGTAYVKGYEVNKLVTNFLTTDKAVAYGNVNSQIIGSKLGNYITLKEAVGAWNLTNGEIIDLYDTPQHRISTTGGSTASQTGLKIGTARVLSLSPSGGALGTANGTINLHLFDVSMNGSNSFANVRSVFYNNSTTADIGGDVVVNSANNCTLKDAYVPLLYYVGSDYTKTIRATDGSVDTTFKFRKTSDVTITSAGAFTLTSAVASETFPYADGTLSSSQKAEIFLTVNAATSNTLPGTATSGAATTTLGGTNTKFQTLKIGDKFQLSNNTNIYIVRSITSNTSLTTDKNLPATVNGNTISKVYLAGDMVDLTTTNALDVNAPVVTASGSGTTLGFSLGESFSGSVSGTISYTMARTSAKEISKILRTSRYVIIDCNSAGTTGPFDLGFSDIFRVKSVRKNATFSSPTDGTDVSSYFKVDNGQRDMMYQHGTITPVGLTLTGADKLLVCLDYFEPDFTLGVGYFSVDSYPVNDVNPIDGNITTAQIPVYKSPTSGITADLRNVLDFRPILTNTAADATTVAGATTNPAVSTTLQNITSGLRLPQESGEITFDYSYYLARRDVVAIDASGQFSIIKGVPASVPITPSCPSNLMSLAKLYIAPYPSLSPSYARALGRNDMACSASRTSQIRYTMKDIGVINQRVNNLENYVSLSLLEKSALDMKILDENGLDRFKNGIFVDSFTSFETSDITNPDHHVCYDPKEGSIRPIFESDAIGYKLYSNTNLVQVDNLLMLPYTEVVALEQPFATSYRNVETTVFRFIGKLYLDPDSDYWVNTKRLASQTYNFGATDADVTPYSVVYGSWQTTVTGITQSDPVLISSATGISSTTSGGGTTSTTYRGITQIKSALPSLISAYGASTPVTVTPSDNYGVATGSSYTITLGKLSLWTSQTGGSTYGIISDNDVITVQVTAGTTTTTTSKTSNTFSVAVSTASQAARTFTETFQSLQTESKSIGDKVVAVAPIADIRPQVIAFEGRGLKANTKHYVYFDGQLMSDYVTPGTMVNVPSTFTANTSASLISKTGNEGDSLYSNYSGFIYGFLRIPSDATKTFRTGTKEVIVTDSPTNESDATSSAVAYFAAQGITQTQQETILSLSNVVTESKDGVEKLPTVYSNTTNVYTTTSTTTTSNTTASKVSIKYTDAVSCMAYSTKFNTPNGEEGIYLSSVDVYFADKDPTLGVWFEIRAMDNAGRITKVQVPGSEVWLTPSQVNTSDDGSTATNVRFKAPVFLLNNQEYAFVIHTVGINPNYYMYVSVLGEKDLITQAYVNDRPLTGTLFTTNNNTDWDIVQRVDLKIRFNRASFTTNVTGEAVLGNEHKDYILLPYESATGANTTWFGERIKGTDELTLSSYGTIQAGYYLVGATSGANAVITSNVSSVFKMNGTGFVAGETVTANSGATASIVSISGANGSIYLSKPKANVASDHQANSIVLVVNDSNGLFAANDVIKGSLSSNTMSIIGVSKQVYSTIQFEPSYVNFNKTTCEFSMATRSNTGSDSGYVTTTIHVPIEFDEEKAIMSRTTEIASYGGVPSNRVKVQMSTPSDYISPMLNINRTYSVYIHNLINSNTSGELASTGGGLKNKYISQVITLADGQDAEDLRVILTAYRPPTSNADIKVYARIANNEDFESIYKRQWIELESFDNTAYSSLANHKDWREFQYKFPNSAMVGLNDQSLPIVGYTNSANTTFQTYRQYQIKIGLQSDNSAVVPRVADLRCIALQR